MIEELKLIVGKYKYPVKVQHEGNKLYLAFPFNQKLLEEVRAMEGAQWHGYDDPPRKVWSITNSVRNWFQLNYLQGINVYENYDRPLIEFTPRRKECRDDQIDSIRFGLTRHYCILGEEMGIGKTLEAIEILEYLMFKEGLKGKSGADSDVWWLGSKSSLNAVELEFRVWKSLIQPRFMTYENLVKVIQNWPPGLIAPKVLIADESSKVKTPTSQRTQATMHLANSIRKDHGKDGYVILMSGSPAPKSPADWWSQCEIACPGYLKEGNVNKFKSRLAIIAAEESTAGGKYNRIVTWKDNDKKCDKCGLFVEDKVHDLVQMEPGYHEFVPSVNEVRHLYERLKGLVNIKFKRDCLQLPEYIYRKIQCKTDEDTLNAARLVALTAKSTIEALTLMRELSDGFQYQTDKVTDERTIVEVPCPKDNVIVDLLDEHDDYKRLIIYAGFTASIDRVFRLVTKESWKVIRVDGRGWYAPAFGQEKPVDLLEIFQSDSDDRIAFVGHQGSAGMGLTLTASPSIAYYSNDFNAESRIQSQARINRPGSRGSNIIDILNLPTDQLVLNNLQKKFDLQAMTMGEIRDAIEYAAVNIRRLV